MELADIKRTRFELDDGVSLVLHDWGGDGPLVLFHHATGVCAAVWHRIARQLTDVCHPVSFDARGHGDADKPDAGYTWQTYAGDLAEVAAELCTRFGAALITLGVGHSLGGIATLLAAQRHPRLFGGALLLEPALITDEMDAAVHRRRDGSTAASMATRLRQRAFASRDDARAQLLLQPSYQDWNDETLGHYLLEGLRDLPTGEVELKCPPAIEASIYALGPTRGVFGPDAVTIPVTVVTVPGSRFSPAHDLFTQQTASAHLVHLEASHQVPMERPDEVVELTRQALAAQRQHENASDP